MMIVILISHIDLSVPWTLTAGAMMATAVAGPWAIPLGLCVGLAVGSSMASDRLSARSLDDFHPRRQRGDARLMVAIPGASRPTPMRPT